MTINIVAVNEEFLPHGKEYWKVDDRVYVNDIYITKVEAHAKWLAEYCECPYFQQIEYGANNPNKYLVELPVKTAKRLFKEDKIRSFVVLNRKVENLRCFAVLTVDEVRKLGMDFEYKVPVRFDFVGV
jgi:hypothetical protein